MYRLWLTRGILLVDESAPNEGSLVMQCELCPFMQKPVFITPGGNGYTAVMPESPSPLESKCRWRVGQIPVSSLLDQDSVVVVRSINPNMPSKQSTITFNRTIESNSPVSSHRMEVLPDGSSLMQRTGQRTRRTTSNVPTSVPSDPRACWLTGLSCYIPNSCQCSRPQVQG